MNFLLFLVIILVAVLYSIGLPLVSNIGSFKIEQRKETQSDSGKPKKKRLKFNLKEKSKNDMGTSSNRSNTFETDPKTGLKRRVIGKFVSDINEFDFDIDELINEDIKEEEINEKKRFEEYKGKEQEKYEELV